MRLTSSLIYSWVWDTGWSCMVSFTLRTLYSALHGADRRFGGSQRRGRLTKMQKNSSSCVIHPEDVTITNAKAHKRWNWTLTITCFVSVLCMISVDTVVSLQTKWSSCLAASGNHRRLLHLAFRLVDSSPYWFHASNGEDNGELPAT
jgi:hypothetical protein